MDRRRGVLLGMILAGVSGMIFYFFTSPILYPSSDQNSGNPITGPNQNPDTLSTLENDVDSCISNPTSDCDQEMLQILNYCQQNKDQNIPACSDARVQQYVEQRGLNRPIINTGQ